METANALKSIGSLLDLGPEWSTVVDTLLPKPVGLSRGIDLKVDLPGNPKNMNAVLRTKPKVLGKVLTYEFKGGTDHLGRRVNFTPAPYDLAEIGRATDVEPYIAQSIRKHREQVLKEGYEIVGSDPAMVEYVKKRLFELTLATGISTQRWLRQLVTNLIMYHNSYLVYRRDEKKSRGRRIRLHGKELDPIAGIFVPDPTTMEVAVDKYGTPKSWRQRIEATVVTDEIPPKRFPIDEVLVCTMDQKSGYSYGTPYILPVLDDVRSLRRLEEIAMIIASKEAFPLYHYKVGTDDQPAMYYEGGGNEVDEVAAQVTAMPLQGNVVTSERHEIKLISREGAALDIEPFLRYFQERVLGGLRLSKLDLGSADAANKGTATNINKALADAAKDYQQVVADCLQTQLLIPLLLEGGFDVQHDNLVEFKFSTIDKEEERAHQNHGSQLCLNSQITCSEFRQEYLGKRPLTDEEQKDTARQMDADVDEKLTRVAAAVKPTPASGSSSSTAKKSTSTNKKTQANKTRPANQNGSTTKKRVKANDYGQVVDADVSRIKEKILAVMKDDSRDPQVVIKDIFFDFVSSAVQSSKSYILSAMEEGLDAAAQEFGEVRPEESLPDYEIGGRPIDRFFSNFVTKSYWKVVNPYMDSVCGCFSSDSENNREPYRAIGAMEAFRKSVRRLAQDQIETARAFAFAKFAKQAGYTVIGLEDENRRRKDIDLTQMRYVDLVPEANQPDRTLRFVSNGQSENL